MLKRFRISVLSADRFTTRTPLLASTVKNSMILEYVPRLSEKRVVLASASPRRKEILSQLGLKFEVVVSSFDETLSKEGLTAQEYALETAKQKALDVLKTIDGVPPCLIIGADTVVEHDGLILEKPKDASDAFSVLRMLSGKTHSVHTGVALALPSTSDALVRSFCCSTIVEFDNLTDGTIEAYINSGEPFGKAGSYGIQGTAASFVKHLSGCYFNVVGFPLHKFSREVELLIKEGLLHI